jgi:tetratricopeptide (TPR) repeat protein/predicted Ser/Thr protein kinase
MAETLPKEIDRYRVIRLLARGGLGKVYLAHDQRLQREVAIKVLQVDEELRVRFAHEARSAARLHHPHIATIFDIGEHAGQTFIAMEYIQGKTLSEMIKARTDLSVTTKLRLAEELCDGLGFAHQAGVIHGDVKPANVMVDAHGSLKLVDFGIARLRVAAMTHAGMLIGTLNYMSPEQMSGQPVDSRSDIFAVGAVCYELLSYRQAFPGSLDSGVIARLLQSQVEPLEQICEGLDPDIPRIVNCALEKDPAARYQELQQMRKELHRVRVRLDRNAEDDAAFASATAATMPSETATRRASDREEVSRRNDSQIEFRLDVARRAFERGEFELAVARCDEALLLDPDHHGVIELLDQVRAAIDSRQAEEWLRDAEAQIRQGALEAAHELVDRAASLDPLSPRVAATRSAIDNTRREREVERSRREASHQALGRGNAAFDRGQFEQAVAAAEELLALDPGLSAAAALKSRAIAAITERGRHELDGRARDAVREANRLFGAGSHEAALYLLRNFEPAHELVSQALDRLSSEFARVAEERRLDSERRVREARIEAELGRAQSEMDRREFAAALERIRQLEWTDATTKTAAAKAAAEEALEKERTAARLGATIREHLAEASSLFERGRFDEALGRVAAALQLDPDNANARSFQQHILTAQRALAEKRAAAERAEQQRRQELNEQRSRDEQLAREKQRALERLLALEKQKELQRPEAFSAPEETMVLRPRPAATSTEMPLRSSVKNGMRALGAGIVAVGAGIVALPILIGHGAKAAAATLARELSKRRSSKRTERLSEPDQPHQSADPVLLGVSAPRRANPGTTFTTRFVAYVKRLEETVKDRLQQLDADAAHGNVQTVVGMSPARGGRWRIGTPVSVRLTVEGVKVHPEIQSFEWNGAENMVSFLVSVPRTASHGTTQLCFEAFIEGVPVAFIPLNVAIGSGTPDRDPVTVTARPMSSAFASYASNDAPTVALLLSALKRWDPQADVFMDCLDLTPNENWRHELEQVIPTKDAFLLFWSTNASKSQWVAWELQHARSTKGVEWIRPMPIDDPEVVPPPDFLQHLHFRDKYLIARQAFLQLKRHREDVQPDRT